MFSLTNTTLGRYEIHERLGKGGMGEVYCAFDTRLRRRVAVKILAEAYTADAHCLQRFKQEAFAASKLNHPNILTIYDIDVIDNRQIIATELIEGETLRKLLERGPLKVIEALTIASQMADALRAAHDVGVIHRDIKPENMMLRSDKYLKLLDFGIAKLVSSQFELGVQTLPGTVIGTPQYMSPEQARGEEPDVRTDIWSFGVVLYEMITGHRPFSGPTFKDLIKAILESEPAPFSSHAISTPPALEYLVRRMLSKQMEKRLSTIADLIPNLRELHLLESTGGQGKALGIVGPIAADTTIPMSEVPSVDSSPRENLLRKKHYRKDIRTIAILPFMNESSDPKAEYLSDGVTEAIINNLSHLPQLRVMSRTSVFRFKGKKEDPAVIGRELGVAAVVTGKLLRVGSRLVIQAELVDVADGAQVWGENYNQRMADIFKIQEQIATKISKELQLKLSVPEKKNLSKRQTVDEHAYLSYLRGRFHWNKRSPEALKLGMNYFNEAIELDPRYSLPYAGLADTYVVLGNQHLMPASEAYPRAKASAIRALELDDTLAEAYATLGFVKGAYDLDWKESEDAFKKAIKLNPGYATAHQWYSAILRAEGRIDEAISEAFTAFQLDPLSTAINLNIALCLYCAQRYDEAIDRYRQISMIEPNFFWTHYGLGLVYRKLGRNAEAISELQTALHLTSDSRSEAVVIADLAYCYGVSGLLDDARQLIERLNEIALVSYVSPCDIAVSHLGLGDRETAFNWLEVAYQKRDEGLMWLKVDPVLDDLRSDPRFLDLLVRVGLASPDAISKSKGGEESAIAI
jgi:eukaryotic-like serine/threonine-protein kinase